MEWLLWLGAVVVVLWIANIYRAKRWNADPIQMSAAASIVAVAKAVEEGAATEADLRQTYAHAIATVGTIKRRAHLASLVRVLAHQELPPDKAEELFERVSRLARASSVAGI